MAVRPHTKTQLKPGIFFSPGFYMGFWDEIVLKRFSVDEIANVKFKQYREMRVGAILAAAQTMASKVQHFVGIPDDEPADVDIVRLEEITMPSGNRGSVIKRLNTQLIRCNLSSGETLYEQAVKKNKKAYEGIIVAIETFGRKDPSNFDEVFKELQKLTKVYPSEILAVEEVQNADGIIQPPGTYGLTRLYPKIGASLVNRNDPKAFFFEPTVFRKSRLAVSLDWEDLGSFELLPPEL